MSSALHDKGAMMLEGQNPQTKKAGATVYLMEELGDARLRCDQLLKYLDRAVKLIDNSSHKDHFFEVAGDLIRSIPDTAFKLHKALQAVALAADRMDYEEIKQDLKPEKAEELERVLKDVRIRHVQRRSDPMTPSEAIQNLRSLASQAKETGALPVEATLDLIANLESGSSAKVASTDEIAAGFEHLASALESPPPGTEGPSRVKLAQILRGLLGRGIQAARLPKVDKIKKDAESALRSLDSSSGGEVEGAVKKAERTLKSLVKDLSVHLQQKEEKLAEAKEDLKEYPNTKDRVRYWERSVENTKKVLESAKKARDFRSMSDALSQIRKWADTYYHGKTAKMDIKDLKSVKKALEDIAVEARKGNNKDIQAIAQKALKNLKVASDEEDKQSRFEEGKSADPTKNMSPEDAKKWKSNKEEYGDKFKEASQWKADSVIASCDVKLSEEQLQMGNVEEVVKDFKKENPDLTDEDIGKIVKQWQKNKDNFKDKSAAMSYEDQHKVLSKNPPKVTKKGDLHVVEVYSPIVGKYIPQAEWVDQGAAKDDLKSWEKAHRETLSKLKGMKSASGDPWKAGTSKTAGLVDPKKIFDALKKSINSMYDARADMRVVHMMLGEILRDASGIYWTDLYNDSDLRQKDKQLYNLDHEMGDAARTMERLQKDLQKNVVKTASEGDWKAG